MSLDTASPTVGQPKAPIATPALVIEATEGGTLVVPLGAFLLGADYAREGSDLVLTGPGGEPTVVIRDYFALDNPPALSTENGAIVEAALAARLAGGRAPGQYAAAGDGVEAEPIGRVAEVTGEATVTRVDGTKVILTKDTPVYQGDVIETAQDAALEVVFVDESTFSVGESGRMVLDELVFDPSTLEGTSTVSVLQGVFVFVSGEIAANNPEQMAIKTPVATIGIRGTAVAISAAQEGEQNKIVLLTEQTTDGQTTTGAIVVTNEAGTVVLDQAFETTLVESVFSAPATSYIAPPDEVKEMVSQVGKAAPDSVQHLAPPSQSSQGPGTEAQADSEGGAAGTAGSGPGPGPGDGPPEAPPLDAAMFAEDPALVEEAALYVEGMLAEDAKLLIGETAPPPEDATLLEGALLDPDATTALNDPLLTESTFSGTMDATLTGDPLAGDNLSGSIGGDTLGGFTTSGFGTTAPTFGFGPALAPPPLAFAAPPPPTGTTGTNNDQFPPPPELILNGLTIIGTSADEVLNGSNLNDFIDGLGGHDSLFGFAGNDVLIGGAGNDLIDGGDGFDIVDYGGTTSGGVSVNLGSGFASGGADVGLDSLVSMEAIGGSQFSDTLTGSSGDNVFKGGGGNDVLTGGGGNDTYLIEGVSGPQLITIVDSPDSSTADVIVMGDPVDDALPIDFDFTISGNDVVIRHVMGNPSTEQVTIVNFLTTGTIELFKFADPLAPATGLSLNLVSGGGSHVGTSGTDFMAVGDSASTTVNGGDGNDFLVGNAGSDVIMGGAGSDEINGNGGGDLLNGGAGDDYYLVIPGPLTSEVITDSSGIDELEIGGSIGFKARNNGTDLIFELTNGDQVSVTNHFSGSPIEFLSVNDVPFDYQVAAGTSGAGGNDLIAGGSGTETLSGGDGRDLIYGAAGADVLLGDGGDDILVGGAGVDTLTGGGTTGDGDRFRNFDPTDGTAASNGTSGLQTGDQVTDFQSGVDQFEFLNSVFGFGSSDLTAVSGTTFFSVAGFDGTNAGASGGGNAYFVFDPGSLTLYHDDGSSGTGYTVIATVQTGASVGAGDIHVSSLGGANAYL